jgi:ATP-dependent RNA helicase DDX24/MAK5
MKRTHTAPKAAHKAHKRQKLESAAANKPKRRVQLNDLGWKTVSMPDRLEDFEGFYGLEEIDDVTVVKSAENGNITFETTKTQDEVDKDVEAAWREQEREAERLEKMIGKEGQELPDEEVQAEAEVEEDEAEVEEDEAEEVDDVEDVAEDIVEDVAEDAESDGESWGGFDDDDNDNEPAVETPAKVETKKEKAARIKQEKKDKKEAKNAKPEPQTKKDSAEDQDGDSDDDNDDDDGLEVSGQGAFDMLLNRAEEDDEEVDVSDWDDMGLSAEVLGALAKLKFSTPSDIQASTIPEIMAGRDVIGKASTGSGKTLAFGIPIIESFLATQAAMKAAGSKEKSPVALIVAPTRELAHQITAHLTALCTQGDFDAPMIATITGGLSVQKQRRQLEKADIIVGTPGRLWEVISSGQGLLVSLKKIRFLVLDEADRLLSQGHYQELGEIIKVLERDDDVDGEEADAEDDAPTLSRQTLVFSATFQKGLQQKLAGKAKGSGDVLNAQQSMDYLLKKLNFRDEKPKFIDANPESQMAARLKEGLIECAGTEKDLYLYSLLLFHPNKRALIFTNSIAAVRRITPFLTNLNLPALPLHSNMIQKARLRSIERFKSRPGSILVATDVAARGLDIPRVDLVVHYHLPRAADTYVHRSGRTARADAAGASIIICGPEEVAGVRRLVAKVHARATQQPAQGKKRAFFIRTLDIDRRIVSRLKPRATLSKKLADAVIAKEKKNSGDDVLRQAAEDLGVDYDSDEFAVEAKGKKGRGAGRKRKEREAQGMTKAEAQGLRAELKGLLSQRINTGVSTRYLTSGGIDVEALMKGEGNLGFLGRVDGLGFEDDE